MRVTVIDRRAMDEQWGNGLFSYVTRTIEISDFCPVCGGPRGEAYTERQYEDGDCCYVTRWNNQCGHVDKYRDVLVEAGVYDE